MGRQGFVGCGYPILLQTKRLLSYGWTQKADPKKAVTCVGDGSLLGFVFPNLYRTNYTAIHFCENIQLPGFCADLKVT